MSNDSTLKDMMALVASLDTNEPGIDQHDEGLMIFSGDDQTIVTGKLLYDPYLDSAEKILYICYRNLVPNPRMAQQAPTYGQLEELLNMGRDKLRTSVHMLRLQGWISQIRGNGERGASGQFLKKIQVIHQAPLSTEALLLHDKEFHIFLKQMQFLKNSKRLNKAAERNMLEIKKLKRPVRKYRTGDALEAPSLVTDPIDQSLSTKNALKKESPERKESVEGTSAILTHWATDNIAHSSSNINNNINKTTTGGEYIGEGMDSFDLPKTLTVREKQTMIACLHSSGLSLEQQQYLARYLRDRMKDQHSGPVHKPITYFRSLIKKEKNGELDHSDYGHIKPSIAVEYAKVEKPSAEEIEKQRQVGKKYLSKYREKGRFTDDHS